MKKKNKYTKKKVVQNVGWRTRLCKRGQTPRRSFLIFEHINRARRASEHGFGRVVSAFSTRNETDGRWSGGGVKGELRSFDRMDPAPPGRGSFKEGPGLESPEEALGPLRPPDVPRHREVPHGGAPGPPPPRPGPRDVAGDVWFVLGVRENQILSEIPFVHVSMPVNAPFAAARYRGTNSGSRKMAAGKKDPIRSQELQRAEWGRGKHLSASRTAPALQMSFSLVTWR